MPENADAPTATTQLGRLDEITRDIRKIHDDLDDVAEQIQDLHEDDFSLPEHLNMPHEDATDLNHAIDQARRALRTMTRIAEAYSGQIKSANPTGDCSKRGHLRPIRTTR